MTYPTFKLKIPADFAKRFPDGDYTVGRGADPRSKAERDADAQDKAPKKMPSVRKKPVRPAAE